MAKGRTDMGFYNPYVSKLNFEVNRNFRGDFDGELDAQMSLNTERIEENEKKNVYLSFLKISLGEKTEAFPFYIELEMSGTFFLDNASDVKEESFANHNTAAILYSYARPVISDIIVKSGFPPFNLPFMNFTEVDLDYNEHN